MKPITLVRDIIDLFYPHICASCDHNKPVRGQIFCVDCLVELPQTHYHLKRDNPFERHFWGRVEIQAGSALYYFIPGGRTQKLLHNIKYRLGSDIAESVGRIYGNQLRATPPFSTVDVIIPVPLHWRKMRQRGFNQSEAFARGLSHSLNVPMMTGNMVRTLHTFSQTRMSREERISNMKNAFKLKSSSAIAFKHVLLVDDVLTTGATLEACANVLQQGRGVVISMATIACGRI